ncbi:iron chaperone [Microbacterium sp. B2969]|uniref:Iron chaperone n=1 Tax=Microbacterium alkaliflavum TaxID=3248839 RepID=A0ABW7Q5R6_9MICO
MTTERTTTKSGFTADERAAMRNRAAELKKQERKGKTAEEKAAIDREDLLDAIADMEDADRAIAQGIDDIVTSVAPQLGSKTWYGFPAYTRDGKVVLFFKPAAKYSSRYATLGFEEASQLDDGDMWPTSYAILSLTKAGEERIAELVKRAAG